MSACQKTLRGAFLKLIQPKLQLRYSSTVNLTSLQYPETIRNKSFAKVTTDDLKFFGDVLGQSRVVTDQDETNTYNTDWMKMFRGQSSVVLKPKTTEEVSKLLNYCNCRKLAVCPQGGNTGLVGGSVPVFDEIILNMSLMNRILKMDEISGVLECESGCILETLDNHVRDKGFIVPLDLGAKGSCQIGGNVSTNAGGLRLLRYGSMHGNVLGLEIVLANGQILDCMSAMKKDNTGYDMKQIFIGAEGTLGVITKVSIQCPPKPESQILAFLGTNSFDQVLKTFKIAKEMLSEVLSSFELMDHDSVIPVERFYNIKPPIAQNPFYMLIEVSGSNRNHDEDKLNRFLEKVLNEGHVNDGTLATSPSHMKAFWTVREHVPMAHFVEGKAFKYDIALPLSQYYKLVEITREKINGKPAYCVAYGHLGDNNLHLTVVATDQIKEIGEILEPFLFEFATTHRGSISGEHGIGIMNRKAFKMSKPAISVRAMADVKALFDPNAILNPYKIF